LLLSKVNDKEVTIEIHVSVFLITLRKSIPFEMFDYSILLITNT
jgi:hypothetical protein